MNFNVTNILDDLKRMISEIHQTLSDKSGNCRSTGTTIKPVKNCEHTAFAKLGE